MLDLVAASPTFDSAYAWISPRGLPATGYRRRPRTALDGRSRVRWRKWLEDSFEESRDGVASALERRYLGTSSARTGSPHPSTRRAASSTEKTHYKDSWYPEYRIAVEIDGPAYHQNERVPLDRDRDNANLALDDVKTFRFGPVAVTERACETAAMVAVTLRRNGWPGSPRPCRRSGCSLRRGRPAHESSTL